MHNAKSVGWDQMSDKELNKVFQDAVGRARGVLDFKDGIKAVRNRSEESAVLK